MVDRSSTLVSAATSDREKAIEQALSQIERRFGKGAIMKLGDVSKIQVEVISTGSIALDLALGSPLLFRHGDEILAPFAGAEETLDHVEQRTGSLGPQELDAGAHEIGRARHRAGRGVHQHE